MDLRNVRTVFLDRDGTINVKAPEGEYIRTPEELVLLPGAAEAVAALNSAGVRTILVTTGSTRPEQVATFPYRPTRVVDSVADLLELVEPAT